MPRKSPYAIYLTPVERRILEEIARKYTSPYCDVVRAKVVLLAAKDMDNKDIAENLDLPRTRSFRSGESAFSTNAWPDLKTGHDASAPAIFPPEIVMEIKALALGFCEGAEKYYMV